jgi:hypothetical protein
VSAAAEGAVGERVLDAATQVAAERFGPRLVAAYALGSLAHGGFNPLVSDVDLALLFEGTPVESDAANIAGIKQVLVDMELPLADRLSTFWGYRGTIGQAGSAGRFPPLDVLDLVLHGRLLAGRDSRDGIERPTHAELVVGGVRFALETLRSDQDVRALRKPELLYEAGVRRLTKRILFPVRFLFTARTGRMGRVELAAEHYLASGGGASALVREAMQWRRDPPDDRDHVLPLLSSQLVPLYRELIDDHVARMEELGQAPLATGLRKWGEELGVHHPP